MREIDEGELMIVECIGALAEVLDLLIKKILEKLRVWIKEKRKNPYWITSFETISKEYRVIEIYKIVVKGTEVIIKIQHYSSDPKEPISKLEGRGVIEGEEMAATYRLISKNTEAVGCLLFKKVKTGATSSVWEGYYFQMPFKKYEGKHLLEKAIELQVIEKMPFWKKFQFMRGGHLFKDYNSINKFMETAMGDKYGNRQV